MPAARFEDLTEEWRRSRLEGLSDAQLGDSIDKLTIEFQTMAKAAGFQSQLVEASRPHGGLPGYIRTLHGGGQGEQ